MSKSSTIKFGIRLGQEHSQNRTISILDKRNKVHENSIVYDSMYSLPTAIPIINVTDRYKHADEELTSFKSTITSPYDTLSIPEIIKIYAPVFNKADKLFIPKKCKSALKNHISSADLKSIHPNKMIAIEMCLMFLSFLSSTVVSDKKYKSLNSTYLHDWLRYKNDNTYIYIKVIKVLLKGTKKKGPIIRVIKNDNGNPSYKSGEYSIKYTLTETYLKCGLEAYTLHSEALIERRNEIIIRKIQESIKNPICRNLLKFYQDVTLPTIDEILAEAKKLVKGKYRTKKNKRLTFKRRKSKSYWKHIESRSFVEEHIMLFRFLTETGLMIPKPGGVKSGGRVVDSFTLMPSWIRNLVRFKGEAHVELDYSALHPNIAISLYDPCNIYIDHSKVAHYLGIERDIAKDQHLSFFNKRWEDLIKSPIYPFYQNEYPILLKNLEEDKKKYGYKITSKRLFDVEVKIMTEVIKRLNNMNIIVGYVYDALLCHPIHKDTVKRVMNETTREFKVYTVVK